MDPSAVSAGNPGGGLPLDFLSAMSQSPAHLLQALQQASNPNLLQALQQHQHAQAQQQQQQQHAVHQQQQQQAAVQAAHQQAAQAAAQQAAAQAAAQVAAQQQPQVTQQNMLMSQLPPSIQALLNQQHAQAQAQAAAAQQNPNLALQQQLFLQAQKHRDLQQQQQQQQQQHQAVAAAAQIQQQPLQSQLPWPEHAPLVNVPHFDAETYKRVNIDIPYSAVPSGLDLPINNVDTLRFFFNFGVSQARAILERPLRDAGAQLPNGHPNTLSLMLKHHANLTAQQASQKQLQAQMSGLAAAAASVQGGSASAPGGQQQSLAAIQNQLLQQFVRGSGPGNNGKIGDYTEAMMLQHALMNPSLSQLRTQSTAGQHFATPLSQQQLQQHPFEQELLRPNPLASAAAAAIAANLGNNGVSIAGNASLQAQQATLNALRSSSANNVQNASTPASASAQNALASQSASATPMPNGIGAAQHHAQNNAQTNSPKDMAELQQKGLLALRSPSLMNESLQRTLQAADAAINQTSASATPTTNVESASATRPASSNAAANAYNTTATSVATSSAEALANLTGQNPALGAQLSAALYHSFILPPVSATAAATPQQTLASTASNGSNATAALGGIGIAAGAGLGAKSITTGSAGTATATAVGADGKPVTTGGYQAVMEIDGQPTILKASEMHYTDTLKKNAGFLPNNNDSRASPSGETRRKSGLYAIPGTENKDETKTEKPLVHMLNYVNNCFTHAKSQIQREGLAHGLNMDSLKPVDYASCPIDPIFRDARKSLDRLNPYNEVNASISLQSFVRSTAGGAGEATTATVSSCPIGIAGPSTSSAGDAADAAASEAQHQQQHANGISQQPSAESNGHHEGDRKRHNLTNGSPAEGSNGNVEAASNRDDDLSSPDEKRLRIASASDDE